MKLGLRGRFILPTLILIGLGMGLLTVASYVVSRMTLRDILYGEIQQLARLTDERITSYVEDRKVDVLGWSQQKLFQTAVQDSFVGKSARQPADELLAKLKKDYRYYENICLVSPSGEVVAASDESLIGKIKVNDLEFFKKSLGGDLFVSDIQTGANTEKLVCVISSPIMEKDRVVGVLFGSLDFGVFASSFIDPVKVGSSGYAYLFRSDGTLIAHPVKSNILKLNMKDSGYGREMMAKEEGLTTYRLEGIERWVAFKKNKEMNWTVGIVAVGDEMLGPIKRLGYISVVLMVGVVVLAAGLIWLIASSIVRPVNRIVAGLGGGTDQVASASGQISLAGERLALGSSEQAAAVEEASSALEQMTAMTQQNAENAKEADHLVKTAVGEFEQGDRAMAELTRSIYEISEASEDTQKIIKTIDEIAFQTNLLALNAAVEAARAGEAGAGFAVVADEVRNLAMRAAEAAKNTASLIEGTVSKVRSGSDLVSKTNEVFTRTTANLKAVGELVGEIAAASREQALGIDNINGAVGEIDKVTQQNAANAEQSAAASVEMKHQAEQMKEFVHELVEIVGTNSQVVTAPPRKGARILKTEPVVSHEVALPRSHLPQGGLTHPARGRGFDNEVLRQKAQSDCDMGGERRVGSET